MTSINIPRDDAANRIDTRLVSDRTVKEVNGYPVVPAVTAHDDVMQAPAQRMPRRQAQRRRHERRLQHAQVLLDTRSGRDRRNAAREPDIEVEGEAQPQTRTGIDVYS